MSRQSPRQSCELPWCIVLLMPDEQAAPVWETLVCTFKGVSPG
jgi:hypothetical protein